MIYIALLIESWDMFHAVPLPGTSKERIFSECLKQIFKDTVLYFYNPGCFPTKPVFLHWDLLSWTYIRTCIIHTRYVLAQQDLGIDIACK